MIAVLVMQILTAIYMCSVSIYVTWDKEKHNYDELSWITKNMWFSLMLLGGFIVI